MKQVFISKHNKELIILESESRAVQPVFSRLGNFCKIMLSDRKLLKNGGFDKYNFSEMKLKIPKIIACFRLMEFLNFWQLIIEHLRFTQHFFLPKLSWLGNLNCLNTWKRCYWLPILNTNYKVIDAFDFSKNTNFIYYFCLTCF